MRLRLRAKAEGYGQGQSSGFSLGPPLRLRLGTRLWAETEANAKLRAKAM